MLSRTVTPPPVVAALDERIRRDPDGRCLSDSAAVLTNDQFGRAVAHLARRFADCGVSEGDVVAVLLPNRREVITTMYAAWVAGATLTPVNPALTDDEVRYQLEDSSATLVVGDDRAAAIADALGLAFVDASSIHARTASSPPLDATEFSTHGEGNDYALIVYTSGTTGRPKGCVLTHENVDVMSRAIIDGCRLGPADRSLLVLPLFHCNGLIVGTVAPLRVGGDVHVADKFSPDTFWQQISRTSATYFSAVPTMYALLVDRGSTDSDTSSLRFAVCGAAPMPAGLIASFEAMFTVPLIEGYGLSECTVAATLNPPDATRKPGTVGRALPGVAVAVNGPNGPTTDSGVTGEVLVQGRTVMQGYLGLPDTTAATIRDGWLYTGDLGVLDRDGYLRLVGRSKDMIIRGGENVAPSEVENVIETHPDVLEVAVVGRPDPVYGEVPVAHVVARTGHTIDPESLAAYCEQRLARFKRPTSYTVHETLPKSAVGKILKRSLMAP